MKIVTWNINGIRTFKNGIKETLDSFQADIICVQETKVTRDLLDERTAIVDGYNSYFSFSRGRSGYSGVATFCKDSATPFAAEEGLSGRLVNLGEAVGVYGDQGAFTNEELLALDSEGRTIITQHKIKAATETETLTVINVYCPRADPEKPERKQFKLQFYRLLQCRAEAIVGPQSHVIILGDINTSHRPIDHCDPDDVEHFEDNPGRKWLDSFLFRSSESSEDMDDSETSSKSLPGGNFVDTFRHFHPTRTNAFTCWSTLTGARQTNYGTRIDYIFASRSLAETVVLNADIMPEVEGSDHCPVWAQLNCNLIPSPRCPALCTRYMPEFTGRQLKLLHFLVKAPKKQTDFETEKRLPGSQEAGEISENLGPQEASLGRKRPANGLPESSTFKGKKSKVQQKTKPHGSLLNFFKPKAIPAVSLNQSLSSVECTENRLEVECSTTGILKAAQNDVTCLTSMHRMSEESLTETKEEVNTISMTGIKDRSESYQDQNPSKVTPNPESTKGPCPKFWKTVLQGPPQPPLCKVHNEPCVLRTVKKSGPNLGRQFFVCSRPQGHTSNPDARCNFFAWVEKRK